MVRYQNLLKPLSGRCVWVFGLPCSGKSTVIQALIDSSREILARISSGDIARRLSTTVETQHMAEGNLFPHEQPLREEILNTINKRKASGSEIVFIDGFPRTPEQVKWCADNQLAGTIMEGCFVQIFSDGDTLVTRAKHRMRDDQDKFEALIKKINTQQQLIYKLDKTLLEYGFPYYTVVNQDITLAVKQLAKFVGLKK